MAFRTCVMPRWRRTCRLCASTAPDSHRCGSSRVGRAVLAASWSTRSRCSMCSSRTCTVPGLKTSLEKSLEQSSKSSPLSLHDVQPPIKYQLQSFPPIGCGSQLQVLRRR